MNSKMFYENYHKKRYKQKKIISKDDFTYHTLIYLFYKYAQNSTNILDIGCGVGTVDLYFASIGKTVTGTDLSSSAISKAKENARSLKVKNITFIQSSFPKTKIKQKFNLIICTEVLEHLEYDELAVQMIHKLASRKGVVIASSPSKNSFLYKLKLLDYFDTNVGHLRRYTPSSFKRLFTKNGFEVLELKKTQGLLRDFLYVNPIGGQMLRLVKRKPFSWIVTFLDDIFAKYLGESDIYIVAQKK